MYRIGLCVFSLGRRSRLEKNERVRSCAKVVPTRRRLSLSIVTRGPPQPQPLTSTTIHRNQATSTVSMRNSAFPPPSCYPLYNTSTHSASPFCLALRSAISRSLVSLACTLAAALLALKRAVRAAREWGPPERSRGVTAISPRAGGRSAAGGGVAEVARDATAEREGVQEVRREVAAGASRGAAKEKVSAVRSDWMGRRLGGGLLCLLGLLTVISSVGHGISTHAVSPPVFA